MCLSLSLSDSLVRGGAFSDRVCHLHLVLNGLVGSRQEDDLTVGGLGHLLHSVKVSDLHGGCRRKNIGSLAHSVVQK
jgi:hypothetical protein